MQITPIEIASVELLEKLQQYNEAMEKYLTVETTYLPEHIQGVLIMLLQELPASPDVAALLSAKLTNVVRSSVTRFQRIREEQDKWKAE
jgi:hypothetical protein